MLDLGSINISSLRGLKIKEVIEALPESAERGTDFFAPKEQNVYSHIQNRGLSLRQERHVTRCYETHRAPLER